MSAPQVTLTTDKPSYFTTDTIVATYTADPVVSEGTLTGEVAYGSGTVAVTGQVEIRDDPVSYAPPILDGWTFAQDPTNPAVWRGTHDHA
jgi:hypothetical protein